MSAAGRPAAPSWRSAARRSIMARCSATWASRRCAEPRAQRVELRRQLGRGDDRPAAIELGDLVGASACRRRPALGLRDAGLGALELGLVVADRVEPRLHQLGDAAVGIADRRVHALELFARMDEFGRGQAQLGKFAVQDEIGGGGFVAGQRRDAFGLQRRAAKAGRRRATGQAAPFCSACPAGAAPALSPDRLKRNSNMTSHQSFKTTIIARTTALRRGTWLAVFRRHATDSAV